MEKKSKKLPIIISVAAVLVIAVVVIVILNSGHRVIKVNFFEGTVSLERSSDEKKLVQGMNLKSKDKVTTGADGLVELLVDTDKHILAQENTCFKITSKGDENKGKLKIKLEYGTTLVEIENKLNDDSTVDLETPNASLSVRGTTFEASYSEADDATVVKVTDGVVKVKSYKDSKEIQAGQMATVKEDEIKIEPLPIAYRDVAAFEARFSGTNEYSGIYVKELVGWTYNLNVTEGTSVDIFDNKGVKIRYWVLTENQVNEWVEDNSNMGWTQSLDYRKNDDGDTIICEELYFNGDLGNGVEVAYQYYKKMSGNIYLSIMVYDEDGGVSLGNASIETYLPLTMDCYYMYGLGVEPN